MPQWMRLYLSRNPLRFHLIVSFALGYALRLLSAYFVYGPQALDDYKHGVWPAYQYFAGLPLDLPDYRSHLLIWVLASFIRVGSWFSLNSALAQVRVMYVGLGTLSLVGLWGTYLFVRESKSKVFAALALYMVALFPLMPFVSTRAFGEAVALSFILLAFGFLEPARRRGSDQWWPWVLGFSYLGIAVYFRFHVGLIYAAYMLVLVIQRRIWPVIYGSLSGLLILFGQVAIDILSGKAPMGTLLAYLAANGGGAAQYGVSPWYNTWLFILALSLPPFSFVFVPRLGALWRREWPWLAPLLFYVLVHSLVPHKEERFLYPVVGLELWAVAWLWSSTRNQKVVRRFYSSALLGLTGLLLPVLCLVNTQEGEIEPPAYVESQFHSVMYLDHQSLFGLSRFQFYFLRPPSLMRAVEREALNAHEVDEMLLAHPEHRAVVLLTSIPEVRDELHALEQVKTLESKCGSMRSAGSVIDQLLYAMNPAHNQRRRPTWYLICERG